MGIKMVKTYKCTGCGAPMEFDADSQDMACRYCGTHESVEMMKELQPDVEEIREISDFFTDDTTIHEETIDESREDIKQIQLHVYNCQGCGAEVLTDEVTAANFCVYCGSSNIMEDRISGEKAPAYIIPFKIKKEMAQDTYKAWTKKGRLTPKNFRSKSVINKVTGLYVPFWLYDYGSHGIMKAGCSWKKREVHGEYVKEITTHYAVERQIKADFIKIPADASEKMPNDVMDKLEPFLYNEMVEFEMPYLQGYLAERYKYTNTEMASRVESRVREYTYKLLRDSITGYTSVNVLSKSVGLTKQAAKYVMFPVWLLNYSYRGKDYLFALNGQTGRSVGDLPISKGIMAKYFVSITVVIFVILMIIGRFFG